MMEEVTSVAFLEQLIKSWDSETLLSVSAALLEAFIGANYTGCIDVKLERLKFSDDVVSKLTEVATNELSFNTYKPYKFARYKHLLWIAKLILIDNSERIEESFKKTLWSIRCISLWQSILPEPVITLKELAVKVGKTDVLQTSAAKHSIVEFLLEKMYIYLNFYEYEKANECLEKALTYANLSVELSGAFGRRTKFQHRDIPQLVVNTELTEIDEDGDSGDHSNICSLPLNVMLNDDTLLETVKLAEKVDKKKLNNTQTACLLAACQMNIRTQHNDELLMEKCLAYVDEVISQLPCWSIYVCALLLRCELEKSRGRRVERACSQAEIISKLVDGIDGATSNDEKRLRTAFVLSSGLPICWEVHKSHAKILRSLGCTGEALRIYERLEDWDSVIDCYKSLEQLEKAERIVRKLIDDDPSEPVNYCLLGDITLQSKYYEEAIKISNGRCARAYKSLGNLLLLRNMLEEAFENFKRSLELQPIQLGVWFNMGHCAWKLERYQEAASAYHRCVQLEPDHFEAWNNLAAAYIRLNQKPRARRILQEALKYNYDHAKIWENYLLICMDTGEFGQAIQAFNRLLDLKRKHEDDEVIGILCKQLLKSRDTGSSEDEQLVAEMCKLLGRLTSSTTCSGKIWRYYAALKKPKDKSSVDEYENYVHLLNRGFRTDYNKQGWEKNVDTCASVLEEACDVVEEMMTLSKQKGNAMNAVKAEARMLLRPVFAIVQREYGENGISSPSESVQMGMKRVEGLLSLCQNEA